MNVRPVGERLLLSPVEMESQTSGGIYIPDTAKEKTQQGKVLAVGTLDKISVEVGATVLYDKYSGTEVRVGSDTFLVVKEKDILAVIE